MSHILIVEDSVELRRELKDVLIMKGYTVFCAATRREVLCIIQNEPIQLCLMDVGLPDCSGFELCEEIRKYYTKSIIMLTAHDQEEEMEKGFGCGADDYVVKPFSLKILLLRIEAQLRNAERQAELPEIMFTGDLQINFDSREVRCKGKQVSVSATEFDIMEILLRNNGMAVARRRFLENVWDLNGTFIEDNTLSVYMSRLRKSLGTYHGEQYIETVKKHGYRWNVSTVHQ